MSMRTWCNHWWTISYENLKSICGPELEAIEKCSEFSDDSWYRIACDDCDPQEVQLAAAVSALEQRFSAATGGLGLVLHAYCEDMDMTGGRELEPHEGIIFCVTGVQQFTPAGEANQHLLQESTWIDAG